MATYKHRGTGVTLTPASSLVDRMLAQDPMWAPCKPEPRPKARRGAPRAPKEE